MEKNEICYKCYSLYAHQNGILLCSKHSVVDDLIDALSDLLDGLDANHDERGGLTDEEWKIRINFAKHVLGYTNE